MVSAADSVPGDELRRLRRERTALGIETAAMTLFEERGFAPVTVEEIAAASGISERTFFRYFATKDSVLVAQAERGMDEVCTGLREQPSKLGAWKALCAALVAHSALEETSREVERWAALSREAPSVVARLIMQGALGGEHEIIDELARRLGVAREHPLPDLMMRVAMAAQRSAHIRWITTGGAEPLVDLVSQNLDFVGAGMERASRGLRGPD
jgi:AcrR family transcriptional regulator